MSATDYTLLDPSLLTPAQRIMREMRLREQADPRFQFNTVPPNELEAKSSGTEDSQLTSQPLGGLSLLSGRQALITLANTLKTELELPPKYCAWLDRFVNCSEAEQRVLHVALNLHTAKLLERLAKSEQYTISQMDLRKLYAAIQWSSSSALISPHVEAQ